MKLLYAIVYSSYLLKKPVVFMHSKISKNSHILSAPESDRKRTSKSKHEINHQKTSLDSEYKVSTV